MIPEFQMLDVIQRVITREGGFVNDPIDPGGATKYGITKKTLDSYRNKVGTIEDVQNLTAEEAAKIYLEKFIKAENLQFIPDPKVFELVVDCAVNHGSKRAIRWLQWALGTDSDGVIGHDTKLRLEEMGKDPAKSARVFKSICARRIRFYVELVLATPDQIKFLRGWIGRATSFLEAV